MSPVLCTQLTAMWCHSASVLQAEQAEGDGWGQAVKGQVVALCQDWLKLAWQAAWVSTAAQLWTAAIVAQQPRQCGLLLSYGCESGPPLSVVTAACQLSCRLPRPQQSPAGVDCSRCVCAGKHQAAQAVEMRHRQATRCWPPAAVGRGSSTQYGQHAQPPVRTCTPVNNSKECYQLQLWCSTARQGLVSGGLQQMCPTQVCQAADKLSSCSRQTHQPTAKSNW